ncbi:MAG TPA: FMN-binding protein [Treponemataceae bacterium]|jgi:electron transport complex protein RnfG|nr:FMN-binding protein [Treponemataceae bacterium]
MKTMIKLSFVLAAYAVVACVGLAFVYIATAPRIAAAAEAETKGALRAIFPAASDFDEVTGQVAAADESVSIDRAYVARDGDAVLGMVLQATGATYKTSTILVGVDMSRRLLPLVFVANTDTPGLGTKTAEEPFVGQFSSKSIDDPFKVGSDVAAISGATISSKGVASIVQLAGYAAGDYLAKNHGAPAGTGSAPVVKKDAPMPVDVALADLWPTASFEDITGQVENTLERSVVITGAWLAMRDGKAIGIAVQAKGQTYKASTILVGVGLDRMLVGVRVNETADSKNYGYAMTSPDFYGPLAGKSVDDPWLVKPTVPDGDVDSISGATISTQGFANMVKVAGLEGARYLAERSGGKPGAMPKSIRLNVIPEEE